MYSLLAAAMNSQLEEVSGKGAGISRAECERTERWNGLRAESHVCQDVHSNIRISWLTRAPHRGAQELGVEIRESSECTS
jgi:hypothetical protein